MSIATLIRSWVPPGLKRRLRRIRNERVHLVIEDRTCLDGFAIFGDTERRDHYVRVFLGAPRATRLRMGLHSRNFASAAMSLLKRYGLVVIPDTGITDELRPYHLRVPRFVEMTLDAGESEASFLDMLPRSARRDLRCIQREGFEPEVDGGPGWAEVFCADYHEKSVRHRHGAEGFVMAADDVRRLILEEHCEFICLRQGGGRVAALLGQPSDSGYLLGRVGWLHGDPVLGRSGVMSALYWFAIRRARELGIRRVRLGGTPAYLEDGVFQFKMKWTAGLDAQDTRFGWSGLLIDPGHPKLAEFLGRWSIIAQDDDGRGLAVFSVRRPGEVNMSAPVERSLSAWYRLDTARMASTAGRGIAPWRQAFSVEALGRRVPDMQ